MVGLPSYWRERQRSPAPDYVPLEHPLRRVRAVVDVPLAVLGVQLRRIGAATVAGSIGPEQTVRALLVQLIFSIRSDRQLLDRIWDSVLLRWFVGVTRDTPKWEPLAFSTKRFQYLVHDSVRELLLQGLIEAHQGGLLSSDALAAARCELERFAADVVAGIGQPGMRRV